MVGPEESENRGGGGGAGVLPVLSSPSQASRSEPVDPSTPKVSVLVQGRFDGPVERYRVASKALCRAASVLGWAAVAIGAAEIAIGVVVFSKLRREGGWWAGLLGALLGIVATGINADTPLGTPLVAWLFCLSLASLLASLVTLLVLDGARWLETKDVEVCTESVDIVCPDSDCTCSTPDGPWDKCFDLDNDDCGEIESAIPLLLASSAALLALFLISGLLLATGIKVKYLGGGAHVGGPRACPGSTGASEKASYSDSESLHPDEDQDQDNRDEGRQEQEQQQQQQQQPSRSWEGAEKTVADKYDLLVEDRKEDEEVPREVLTGAEPWAVGYVERVAGGGNKRRRDELNSNPGRGGNGGGGGGGSGEMGGVPQ
ncbi:unnamed protein product [Pylaiella littoralis]